MKERNIIKKHNLLHVVGTLGMGGAEMLLYHYSKSLGQKHYNHFVYCFGIDGPIKPILENIGVKVSFGPKLESIKKPIKFFVSVFSLFKNLLAFIKQNNIHTIHSHNGQSDKLAVIAGKLSKVAAFPTIHNTMFTVDRRNKFDPRVYMVKAMDSLIYRNADKVIAVSEEVKEVVCKRYNLDKSKVVIVKNGIFFKADKKHDSEVVSSSITSGSTLKIFAVGRLTYQKNFDVLVKAVGHLLKGGHSNIKVEIAGVGEDFDKLSLLISDLQVENHVKLLGVRSDVLELMQSADVLVMPSRYEGLSIAMIEALACGLPIIASDAPGLRDHIKNDYNGFLFPVGNHKMLAKAIQEFVENKSLQSSLSQGAHKSFLDNFDMQRNIEPLIQLIASAPCQKGNMTC